MSAEVEEGHVTTDHKTLHNIHPEVIGWAQKMMKVAKKPIHNALRWKVGVSCLLQTLGGDNAMEYLRARMFHGRLLYLVTRIGPGDENCSLPDHLGVCAAKTVSQRMHR